MDYMFVDFEPQHPQDLNVKLLPLTVDGKRRFQLRPILLQALLNGDAGRPAIDDNDI